MSLFQNILPSLNRTTAPVENTVATETVPSVKPAYDIKETAEAYAVTVHLPGVTKDGLEITAEDGQVRLVGHRAWQRPETWASFYRESNDRAFELILTHDNAIDAEKIGAELRDGVLRLTLPKAASAKPRKVAVN
jgi:HSP20 family protein